MIKKTSHGPRLAAILPSMVSPSSQRSTSRFARIFALSVLLAGIGATLLAARIAEKRHEREVMRVFTAESEAMRQSVARQLALFFDVLNSIGALRELSDRISMEDFEEFAAKGMQFQRRLLNAYGFVQRLPHALREEMKAGGGFFADITEPGPDGRMIIAGARPEYFPLVSQQPEGALSFPNGIDMAALPGAAEAIFTMESRRGPAIARSLRIKDPQDQDGYFVFSPLFDSPGIVEARLSGFTVSILWPQIILERALADVAPNDILVRFFDETWPGDAPSTQEVAHTAPITVADREWTFETRAAPEYLAARPTMMPHLILLSGSVSTLLLSMVIWTLAGRTVRIEAAVQERTRELEASMKERMRLERDILEISDREKQQVGQDLHDSLGQKLTGAVFLSRALSDHPGHADEEVRRQSMRINEILKESVAQVRRMARGLSPVELGQEGLAGALGRLAEETSSVYGITCVFHPHEEAPAPANKVAHHLYAIAMEAVTNAVRHGQATEVIIEWSRRGDKGELTIEDNGKGLDPNATQSGGMGLRIMQFRASMFGGRVEFERRRDGGVRVECQY